MNEYVVRSEVKSCANGHPPPRFSSPRTNKSHTARTRVSPVLQPLSLSCIQSQWALEDLYHNSRSTLIIYIFLTKLSFSTPPPSLVVVGGVLIMKKALICVCMWVETRALCELWNVFRGLSRSVTPKPKPEGATRGEFADVGDFWHWWPLLDHSTENSARLSWVGVWVNIELRASVL